jgi:hypothetical protein
MIKTRFWRGLPAGLPAKGALRVDTVMMIVFSQSMVPGQEPLGSIIAAAMQRTDTSAGLSRSVAAEVRAERGRT